MYDEFDEELDNNGCFGIILIAIIIGILMLIL